MQSTGVDAQNELMRQFMAQWKKDGLIIDERWNSGGQIPDRFIELLNRPIVAYWAVRDGAQPAVAAGRAPRAAGDADQRLERIGRRRVSVLLPRRPACGPLIGTRTWGGLIGISGAPALADGGNVTVPTFRMYDPKGEWFAEGHGVEPDIAVDEDPTAAGQGHRPAARARDQGSERIVSPSSRRRRRVRRTSGGCRKVDCRTAPAEHRGASAARSALAESD